MKIFLSPFGNSPNILIGVPFVVSVLACVASFIFLLSYATLARSVSNGAAVFLPRAKQSLFVGGIGTGVVDVAAEDILRRVSVQELVAVVGRDGLRLAPSAAFLQTFERLDDCLPSG